MDVLQLCVFLLQTHFCWSQNTLIVPSQPITASVGSDVTLPCQLDPVKDLRDMVVEWSRHDLMPRYIHIRRDGLDLLMDQNSLYLGRTSVSESRLQQGDMSLSLTKVRPSDGGTYRCYIPLVNVKAEVTLLVVSVAPPSMSLIKERSGSPVLRCESRGWYPEPELEWLDSEGTVLLRTEAQRGASEELFSVSSRLSVEQRLGNTFTCRVRQQESGQSREAQLSITDDLLEPCLISSWSWILLCLSLVLFLAVVAVLVVLKFKNKRKKSKSIEQVEKEEQESMIKKEEITNKLKQKTENELRYITDVTKRLTVTKDFTVKLKDKHLEAIHRLKSLIDAERIKIGPVLIKDKNRKQTQYLEGLEREKEEFEKAVEALDDQIKTLDEGISVSTQRRGQLEAELQQMEKQLQETKTQQETREEEEKVNVQVNVQVNAQDQPQGAEAENKQGNTDQGLDETCEMVNKIDLCDNNHFS